MKAILFISNSTLSHLKYGIRLRAKAQRLYDLTQAFLAALRENKNKSDKVELKSKKKIIEFFMKLPIIEFNFHSPYGDCSALNKF